MSYGRRFFWIAVLAFITNVANAQVVQPGKNGTGDTTKETGVGKELPFDGPSDTNAPFTNGNLEVEAHFKGGDSAFTQFVSENFQYPPRCLEEGINGYVMRRFVVDKKGKISQITVIEETKSCPEFSKEAVRILKMSPDWVPAIYKGQPVKTYRQLPIVLNVQ